MLCNISHHLSLLRRLSGVSGLEDYFSLFRVWQLSGRDTEDVHLPHLKSPQRRCCAVNVCQRVPAGVRAATRASLHLNNIHLYPPGPHPVLGPRPPTQKARGKALNRITTDIFRRRHLCAHTWHTWATGGDFLNVLTLLQDQFDSPEPRTEASEPV